MSSSAPVMRSAVRMTEALALNSAWAWTRATVSRSRLSSGAAAVRFALAPKRLAASSKPAAAVDAGAQFAGGLQGRRQGVVEDAGDADVGEIEDPDAHDAPLLNGTGHDSHAHFRAVVCSRERERKLSGAVRLAKSGERPLLSDETR